MHREVDFFCGQWVRKVQTTSRPDEGDAMPTPDDTQSDPQAHLDHDPTNRPASPPDAEDDPAHDAGEDEGWESEGGSNPTGPATDS